MKKTMLQVTKNGWTQSFSLKDGVNIIGSGEDCDVVINDKNIPEKFLTIHKLLSGSIKLVEHTKPSLIQIDSVFLPSEAEYEYDEGEVLNIIKSGIQLQISKGEVGSELQQEEIPTVIENHPPVVDDENSYKKVEKLKILDEVKILGQKLDNLEDEKREYESHIVLLKREDDAVKSKLEDAKYQLKRSEKTYLKKKEKLEQIEVTGTKKKEKLSGIERKIQSELARMKQLEEDIRIVKDNFQLEEKKLQRKRAEVRDVVDLLDVHKLENREIVDLSKNIHRTLEKNSLEVEELKKQKRSLLDEIKSGESKNKGIAEQLEQLLLEQESLSSDILEKKLNLEQFKKKIEDKKIDLSTLEDERRRISEKVKKAETFFEQKNSKLIKVKEDLDTVKEDFDALSRELTKKRDEKEDLVEESRIVRAELEIVKSGLDDCKVKLKDSQKELREEISREKIQLKKEIIEKQTILDRINVGIEIKQTELDEIDGKIHKYETENKELRLLKDSLTREVESLTISRNDAKNEYQDFNNQVEYLKGQKKELANTLRSLEEKIEAERELIISERKSCQDHIDALHKKAQLDIDNKKKSFALRTKNLELQCEEVIRERKEAVEAEINKKRLKAEYKLEQKIKEADTTAKTLLEEARMEVVNIRNSGDLYYKEKQKRADQVYKEITVFEREASEKVHEKLSKMEEILLERRAEANQIISEAHEIFRVKEEEGEIIISQAKKEAKSLFLESQRKCQDLEDKITRDIETLNLTLQGEKDKHDEYIRLELTKLRNYINFKKKNADKVLAEARKHIDHLKFKNSKYNEKILKRLKRKQYKHISKTRDKLFDELKDAHATKEKKWREYEKEQFQEILKLQDSQKNLLEEKKKEADEQVAAYFEQEKGKIEQLKKDQVELLKKTELNGERKLREEMASLRKDFDQKKRDLSCVARNQVYNLLVSEYGELFSSLEVSEKDDLKRRIGSLISSSILGEKSDLEIEVGVKADLSQKKDVGKVFKKLLFPVLVPTAAALVVFLDIGGFRTSIANRTVASIESSQKASDEFSKKQVDKWKDDQTFKPEKTPGYKNTYVDNTLYTKDFVSVYQSEKFQNEWIVGLHEFMVDKLELSEEMAVNYVSMEGTLVSELSDLSKGLNPKYLDQGLIKLKEKESKFTSWADEQIKNKEQLAKITEFKKNFFEKFVSSGDRVPATTDEEAEYSQDENYADDEYYDDNEPVETKQPTYEDSTVAEPIDSPVPSETVEPSDSVDDEYSNESYSNEDPNPNDL